MQRPSTDNTQHSLHAPGGILTRNPGKREARSNALDRAPNGIGRKSGILERYPILGPLRSTKTQQTNPGLRDEKPATNHLQYGTVQSQTLNSLHRTVR